MFGASFMRYSTFVAYVVNPSVWAPFAGCQAKKPFLLFLREYLNRKPKMFLRPIAEVNVPFRNFSEQSIDWVCPSYTSRKSIELPVPGAPFPRRLWYLLAPSFPTSNAATPLLGGAEGSHRTSRHEARPKLRTRWKWLLLCNCSAI